MRNTIISIVCVVVIFVYSIFTMTYVNDFSKQIANELPSFFSDSNCYVNIDNIKNIYSNKQKILSVIVNRDDVEDIENIIINLETAVKFSDQKEIYNNTYALKSTLEHITRLNGFTI